MSNEPEFDVIVTFMSPTRTVLRLKAPSKRHAEEAALALVKSDPRHYEWEVRYPVHPAYKANAVSPLPGASRRVMTVTEETTMVNPTSRPTGVRWWSGAMTGEMMGPFKSAEEAYAQYEAKHGKAPARIGHTGGAGPKRRGKRASGTALVSSTRSARAEKIIKSAAASVFGKGKTTLDFEHGQWFATVKVRGGEALYSVVDTYHGSIGFEPLESYEY